MKIMSMENRSPRGVCMANWGMYVEIGGWWKWANVVGAIVSVLGASLKECPVDPL
jgi:hypothetical protein